MNTSIPDSVVGSNRQNRPVSNSVLQHFVNKRYVAFKGEKVYSTKKITVFTDKQMKQTTLEVVQFTFLIMKKI